MADLMLYPPPNDERLSPEELPRDAETFKRWANLACVEWPPDLNKKAAFAIYAFENLYGSDSADIDRFRMAYFDWWSLPENAKETAMSGSQFTSRRRDGYRRQARNRHHVEQRLDEK